MSHEAPASRHTSHRNPRLRWPNPDKTIQPGQRNRPLRPRQGSARRSSRMTARRAKHVVAPGAPADSRHRPGARRARLDAARIRVREAPPRRRRPSAAAPSTPTGAALRTVRRRPGRPDGDLAAADPAAGGAGLRSTTGARTPNAPSREGPRIVAEGRPEAWNTWGARDAWTRGTPAESVGNPVCRAVGGAAGTAPHVRVRRRRRGKLPPFTGGARQAKTTVRVPLRRMRRSACHLTARARAWHSTSRPTATSWSGVTSWPTRSTSCSMIGPSSRSAVT